ncbi:helix-turn-helix transcriptional regulator [Fibrella arboris]|uniref:helix-turn-helix transcriptional regulator n=1 Tax=Fibrella arboris TaxID=3242486 RepID=UPI0035217363
MAIHERLSTGIHYTKEELLEAIETATDSRPSEKTLYNDIRALKDEYGAPIPERDRSGKPYFYTEPFSLFGLLNPTDATLANEAVALVRQMNTLPQFAGLEEILLKFEQQPGVIGKARESVVQFEQNTGYTGLNWLRQLYDAILQDHPILLDYQDFNSSSSTRYEVSPYLLKEYNNRWFLLGYAEGWYEGRPFPLDRIQRIVLLTNKRRRSGKTDWRTEFADIVGVTRIVEHPVEPLLLRVWLPRAKYVATKPFHTSQNLVNKTDTYLDFQYNLRWNPELIAKLLELGPDAELLKPAHRRAELAEKVKLMMHRYTAK